MTSSPSFRRELPTSKVAGGISMGLNSPRPEGTLSLMLSHLTLRIQAPMKQYAIRPLSLLSASRHRNILRKMISFSLAFIPHLANVEFPLTSVKIRDCFQSIISNSFLSEPCLSIIQFGYISLPAVSLSREST